MERVCEGLREDGSRAPEPRQASAPAETLPPAPQLEFPKGPFKPTPGRAREVKIPPPDPALPPRRAPRPSPPRVSAPRGSAPRRVAPGKAARFAWLPRGWRARTALAAAVLLAVAVPGAIYGPGLYRYADLQWSAFTGSISVEAAVERIVVAESNGDANAKNKRSTAVGPAQFLDQTWLELIRAHRSDLARLGEKETLDLRRDTRLAREMAARFLERNAVALRRQCLPVTLSAAYLAHFAGGAGAAAILTAPDTADAAATMAKADATGRTTREKIVKANPFLEKFTIADLKTWANGRMRGREILLAGLMPMRGATSEAALIVRVPAAAPTCRRATTRT